MFDRVNTRENRILDSLSAVRVGRNLPSSHMSFLGSSFQLVEGKLRSTWAVAFGKYASRGQNLYDVNPILHLGAHHVANLVHAVSNLKIPFPGKHHDARLRREVVEVAVPSGDGNPRPARHNARTNNKSLVDCIAQIDSHKGR